MNKRFSGPQIVAKFRQADVLIGQGKTVPEVCKENAFPTNLLPENPVLFLKILNCLLLLTIDPTSQHHK